MTAENYRPISHTCAPVELLENIVNTQRVPFREKNAVVDPDRSMVSVEACQQ